MTAEEKVLCRTPTPGKKPVRIDLWKFDTVRRAILQAVPIEGEGLLFKELARHVESRLSAEDLAKLGSIGWYTTTVKLELEMRGEIKRIDGAVPQRLLRHHPS
ncbi:MAG: hypothetical protein P8X96_21695 [Desulfobacteraceae bacterium]|jgi:hypothetical protein